MLRTEDELIKKCDLIFVQGRVLRDKYKHLNNNMHIFSFGVRIENSENFKCTPEDIPADIKEIKNKVHEENLRISQKYFGRLAKCTYVRFHSRPKRFVAYNGNWRLLSFYSKIAKWKE